MDTAMTEGSEEKMPEPPEEVQLSARKLKQEVGNSEMTDIVNLTLKSQILPLPA